MCSLPLPAEILVEILSYVIHLDTINVLLTSHLFYSIGQNILHHDLTFNSIAQIHRFTENLANRVHANVLLNKKELARARNGYLVCYPRSLCLDVAGGASWVRLPDSRNLVVSTWPALQNALKAILNDLEHQSSLMAGQELRRLKVETVRFRLNSHTNDTNYIIYDALSQLDTQSFEWTGPDPPHHFSTAIVMQAVPYLFRALATHSQLTHIKLTNISFPEIGVDATNGSVRRFDIPYMPSLQHLYLGQSTFLSAPTLARFLLNGLQARTLQKVTLVDVYESSIWGPRLRMPRIIGAARALLAMEQELGQSVTREDEMQQRLEVIHGAIMDLVTVVVETERIEGGDRGY
ncbi:hypothetical protein Moror_3073 [Moniliophthora roreri MCA 2997]|uniref:F-box domain-containing protein n=1 Tax=Moniliophthora roreri (strain MCA 2997) TaxID=1381753 RepID=V2X898_MONRO|nr:hypothetical protein Moror_3073 [Moniliophthora roreri MCA 2997]